jgi:transcriptional regulator with XRE-family HTH domain
MKKQEEVFNTNQFSKYLETNKTKIDESLVSLRFLKQIDIFLYNNSLNQKDLAVAMNVSEPYISQLMAGTKKINMKFINSFEKKFKVEFSLKLNNVNSNYLVIDVYSDNALKLNLNRVDFTDMNSFSFSNNTSVSYELKNKINPIVIIE